MAQKVYQMKYDDVIDKDIHSWLEALPRGRKAELVRNAIRFYIQSTNGMNTAGIVPYASDTAQPEEETAQKEEKPKKRPSNKLSELS